MELSINRWKRSNFIIKNVNLGGILLAIKYFLRFLRAAVILIRCGRTFQGPQYSPNT